MEKEITIIVSTVLNSIKVTNSISMQYDSRNFNKRIAEHAGRSFRTNSLLSHPPHSAIRDHVFGCNSPISINKFQMID